VSDLDRYIDEVAEHGFRAGEERRFRATWAYLENGYFARLALVVEPYKEWRDRFRAAAQETVRLVETFPREARFVVVDSLTAGEVGRESQRILTLRLVALIDAARKELAEPDRVPESTAGWIVAMFFDRVYRRCTSRDEPDLRSQLPELLFLAISAYFGTAAGLEELIPPP
jgi:hypothetical protein